jgi:protein ImuA
MEEGLRTPGIAAVVGEVGSLPPVASRRLQLAAQRSGITAFLVRRWRNAGEAARERLLPNAAATRWRISTLPSLPAGGTPEVGEPRWRIELLRCRGGGPGSWETVVGERRAADEADPLSLAAALADRPPAPLGGAPSERVRRAG